MLDPDLLASEAGQGRHRSGETAAELAREVGVDEELTRDVIWRIIASARDAQEGRTRWGPPLQDASEHSGG